MTLLSDLPNISTVLENQLKMAEIDTPGQLKQLGAEIAFLRLLAIDESSCINKLFALEGAIQNIRWHNHSTDRKEELKTFFSMKKLS